MSKGFDCERCGKHKDLIDRGKRTIGKQGICIGCLKRMGVYKEMKAVSRPRRK